jgi:hypothetical protein
VLLVVDTLRILAALLLSYEFYGCRLRFALLAMTTYAGVTSYLARIRDLHTRFARAEVSAEEAHRAQSAWNQLQLQSSGESADLSIRNGPAFSESKRDGGRVASDAAAFGDGSLVSAFDGKVKREAR